MTLKFRLLGSLEVVDGHRPISVAGAQQRALLAHLVINAGRVVSYRDLAGEMWPAQRAENVRPNTVHAQLARLRQQLGGPSVAGLQCQSSGGYMLHVDPDDVDVSQFALARTRASALAGKDPARAIALLRGGLALWRGSALQDSVLGPRGQAVAARLEEARLQAHEQLAALAVAHGDPASVVDELQELAVLHPMRETLLASLMSALHACGRRAEALTVFRSARERFDAELGVEPGPFMHKLHVSILQAVSA